MNILNTIYQKTAGKSLHSKTEEPDVNGWERFLDSLPEAKDAIERAYNKYLCWKHFISKGERLFLNLTGICFLMIQFPLLLAARKRTKEIKNILVLEKHSDVGYKDVFPDDLYKEYAEVKVIDNVQKKLGLVSKESRHYLMKCIRKYPAEPFFIYFICKELIAHDYFIMNYSPKAVAVYVNERNVASPILKEMYKAEDRRFISFMHGEYLLNLVQAYMSFTDYYIWDNSYMDNFRNFLKCDIDQYHVYVPGKLKKKWHLEEVSPTYRYTYYFSNESEECVEKIFSLFSRLQAKGIPCKTRPHPRFMENVVKAGEKYRDILIEEPKEVTLEQSLGDTEFAVGLTTTVLFEAEVEGRKIVIDDVSNPASFSNLKSRRFRLLSHEYYLLSDVIREHCLESPESQRQ